MKESIEVLFGLLGGLAIFIFGMNMMSECLQKAAGERMKQILAMLTANPLMGVLAGVLVTAVLQSSSATTVMAIGFVSAGLMTLPQAVSIILGANIGTTMTAQLIAFKLSDYIFIIIFIGFIVSFLTKNEKIKSIGQTVFAFGLLFLGIETMGNVMKPLASSPVFLNLIEKVSDIPVLGVLLGTVMTVVVQSSSATIAVLQNFASQPAADGVSSIIGLAGAIPILLGDNIGTTITAILASVGQTKNAKRTAMAHCLFNISGCLLFIWFVHPFARLIQMISPKGPEIEVIARQIANAHTTFNVVMTLIWVPLIGFLVKAVLFLIPDGEREAVDPAKPRYLDDNVINQPTAALQLVTKEVGYCGEIVKDMLRKLFLCIREDEKDNIVSIQEQSAVVESLNQKITEYLSDMFTSGALTEQQAGETATLMYVLSDIERLSIVVTEAAGCIRENLRENIDYSDEAKKDLSKSLRMMEKMFRDSLDILFTGDMERAMKLTERKQKALTLDIKMRKGHMNRVNKGKCKSKLTKSFNQMINCINRMSNSCINIVDVALNGESSFPRLMNTEG